MPLPYRLTGLLLVLTVPSVAAQSTPQYVTAAHDTLRYAERTLDISTLDSPSGIVTQQTRHDATIALRLPDASRAEAWYEALTISTAGPQGERTASLGELVGRPFRMRHDGHGHLSEVASPEIPAALDSLTDLRRQFDDFLLVLPDAPFFPGLEWSDSLRRESATAAGGTATVAVRRTYRVTGDTLTAMGAAWIIATSADLELTSDSPAPGGTLRIQSSQRGTESGTDLWSRTGGRMLSRSREGELQGAVTVIGGTTPVELPQLRRYESTLTLLSPR